MLASAVVAGLLIGIATRGSVRKLAEIRMRWLPVFLAATVLRLLAAAPIGEDPQRVVFILALWTLTGVAAVNLALPGMRLIAAGIASNAVVVTSNRGAMPVSLAAVEVSAAPAPNDALHQVMPAAPILGDVIPVPTLGVYSLGDLALSLGVLILIVSMMRDTS